MTYFPLIAEARVCTRYELGDYRAELLDQIRSIQTTQYYFLLIVYQGDAGTPTLAIASEYSDAHSQACPFLGVFPGDGHENYGGSTDWLDRDKFTQRALEMVRERLGVTVTRTEVVPPRRPWWKFW